MTRPTLADRLSGRDNALNLVRLVLALLVIVAHTWDVGGFGLGPLPGGMSLGGWAVAGFFAISGYLVLGSRLSATFQDYLTRRFLRIFPGYWACLVVVAFGFAPLAAALGSGSFEFTSALGYIGRNLGLVVAQAGVGTTLATVPYPWIWNSPLWTLAYEFLAYLIVGGMVSVITRRRWQEVAFPFLLLVGEAALVIAHVRGSSNNVLVTATWLGCFFLAGSVARLYADRIPVDGRLAIASVALLVLVSLPSMFRVFGHLPMAYLVLWLGAVLKSRIGARNDVSYGTYIYAFPIQQTLAVLGVHLVSGVLHWALSTLLTLGLAWLSWRLVEKPTMRLRQRLQRPVTTRAEA